MNAFLLLMALVLTYGIAMPYKSDKELRQIYRKCQDNLTKCRKSAMRSRKRYVQLPFRIGCRLVMEYCLSEIPFSRRDIYS
ncbi:hypothetical protein ScPMuIL_002448 [Solemya velum]